ncbi:MAG TPA: C2 family cysteine protease [Isosphaeraceae bacterium]|nr:C2 family cysteine protease [Isosphaeraceae bacterium]
MITTAELQSLQALVTPSGAAAVNMASPVQSLTYKVVDGDPANAQYQGTALGNLQAGNPASHLQELVDKWFLGQDTPTIDMEYLSGSSVSYSLASGTLFGSGGPSYKDVYQGEEGDCWLLSSLAVTAAHDPSLIQSMFTSDGTQMENGVPVQVWTVRFYDNGVASYLTVNNLLPASSGNLVYAGGFQSISNPNNVLWVELAEKAYAQLCASGWNSRPESNAFASLNGGSASTALPVIAGAQESTSNAFANSTSFINAIDAGMLLTLGTYPSGNNALGIVGNHDYSVVGYNASNQTFTLLNPWGWNNNNAPGILNLTWTLLAENFFLDGNGNRPSSASLPQTGSDSSPSAGSMDTTGPMEAIIFSSSDDMGHGSAKAARSYWSD